MNISLFIVEMFYNDQNDENFGATDVGDEDDFAPGTTCLTSPVIGQFSEDERENQIKPQRMFLNLLNRMFLSVMSVNSILIKK